NEGEAQQDDRERRVPAQLQLVLYVAQRIDGGHVESHTSREVRDRAQDDWAEVSPQDVYERHAAQFLGGAHGRELRALLYPQPDRQRDDDQDGTGQERQAPPPGGEAVAGRAGRRDEHQIG